MRDAVVNDGNMLHENPAGKGSVAIDKHGDIRAVDQSCINQPGAFSAAKAASSACVWN